MDMTRTYTQEEREEMHRVESGTTGTWKTRTYTSAEKNELCDELFEENDKLKQEVKYWRERYYEMFNRTTQLECDVFNLLEHKEKLKKQLARN